MQEEGPGSRLGAGFKSLLGGSKDAAQPVTPSGAEQAPAKSGRFASLRAKMTKNNDTAIVGCCSFHFSAHD